MKLFTATHVNGLKELLNHCDTILIKYARKFQMILNSHASHATIFRNIKLVYFLIQIISRALKRYLERVCFGHGTQNYNFESGGHS